MFLIFKNKMYRLAKKKNSKMFSTNIKIKIKLKAVIVFVKVRFHPTMPITNV